MSASHHRSDQELIAHMHNTSRFCLENRQIAWILLLGTVVWGIYGYRKMPQRKDPDIPVKQAKVITPWPGASAEKVEQLLTREIEKTIASNSNVSRIESVSRTNISEITFTLSDRLKSTGQTLDDIGQRLSGITGLPQGSGPISYQRDFGDTATVLLTVASPKADPAELDARAAEIRKALEPARAGSSGNRATMVFCFPPKGDKRLILLGATQFAEYVQREDRARDVRIVDGPGFVAVDGETGADDQGIHEALRAFTAERYHSNELHPDAWAPFIVRDLASIGTHLRAVAGEKYSYREIDNFTDAMEKALLATERTPDGPPLVAKVKRTGILNEKIYLFYSQERLASYGLRPESLSNVLSARNITMAGGQMDLTGKRVAIDPSGEFRSEQRSAASRSG